MGQALRPRGGLQGQGRLSATSPCTPSGAARPNSQRSSLGRRASCVSQTLRKASEPGASLRRLLCRPRGGASEVLLPGNYRRFWLK